MVFGDRFDEFFMCFLMRWNASFIGIYSLDEAEDIEEDDAEAMDPEASPSASVCPPGETPRAQRTTF